VTSVQNIRRGSRPPHPAEYFAQLAEDYPSHVLVRPEVLDLWTWRWENSSDPSNEVGEDEIIIEVRDSDCGGAIQVCRFGIRLSIGDDSRYFSHLDGASVAMLETEEDEGLGWEPDGVHVRKNGELFANFTVMGIDAIDRAAGAVNAYTLDLLAWHQQQSEGYKSSSDRSYFEFLLSRKKLAKRLPDLVKRAGGRGEEQLGPNDPEPPVRPVRKMINPFKGNLLAEQERRASAERRASYSKPEYGFHLYEAWDEFGASKGIGEAVLSGSKLLGKLLFNGAAGATEKAPTVTGHVLKNGLGNPLGLVVAAQKDMSRHVANKAKKPPSNAGE